MIPMLFPHASSVFSHGSPNLSLTTLQYCHFDHAKRPQQHEPSVLPSHSPPTSPGRHWGSRHLRIVSAGSWINKDQVAKLQRKKQVQQILLQSSVTQSWYLCKHHGDGVNCDPNHWPLRFFFGGGRNRATFTNPQVADVPYRGPCLGTSFFFHIQTQPWNVGELDQFHGSMTSPQWCWKINSRLGKKNLQITHDFCKGENDVNDKISRELCVPSVNLQGWNSTVLHSPDLSWKLNMMIYP